MKKISVIIPCFNVEHLVGNCIKSLVNQTIGLDAMEFIFVNDASTDGTYEVLCHWEKQYPDNIMVINYNVRSNAGGARNIGMSYASGEYLGFVDSDDIVEWSMYQDMYEMAKKIDADMVSCVTRRCTLEEYGNLQMSGSTAQRTADTDWAIVIENPNEREIFLEGDTNASACNRIFRRKMIQNNKIVFLEKMFYEDIYFSGLVRRYVNVVGGIEEVFYNHIVYETSSSINQNQAVKEEYILSNVMMYDEIKRRNLYNGYEHFYDMKLVNEYITYIYACVRMFEMIDCAQWNRAISMVRERIDVTKEYTLKNGKIKTAVQRYLFDCLRKTVGMTEVMELIKLCED